MDGRFLPPLLEPLADVEVARLLSEHLADMFATSPAESVHALDHSALSGPSVTFWTAREEGELHPYFSPLVAGVAILTRLEDAGPSVRLEQSIDDIEVRLPDGKIDVLVVPRHSPGVEVDRPAAEQPVVDPLPAEKRMQPADRLQLCAGSVTCGHDTILSGAWSVRARS